MDNDNLEETNENDEFCEEWHTWPGHHDLHDGCKIPVGGGHSLSIKFGDAPTPSISNINEILPISQTLESAIVWCEACSTLAPAKYVDGIIFCSGCGLIFSYCCKRVCNIKCSAQDMNDESKTNVPEGECPVCHKVSPFAAFTGVKWGCCASMEVVLDTLENYNEHGVPPSIFPLDQDKVIVSLEKKYRDMTARYKSEISRLEQTIKTLSSENAALKSKPDQPLPSPSITPDLVNVTIFSQSHVFAVSKDESQKATIKTFLEKRNVQYIESRRKFGKIELV